MEKDTQYLTSGITINHGRRQFIKKTGSLIPAFSLYGCSNEFSTPSTDIAPPNIQVAPASQTVTSGNSVTFRVIANGGAPLSYQWQQNGINISGANQADYSINAVTIDDHNSSFQVQVSNAAGSITSSTAQLTVIAALTPPIIITEPASTSIQAGESTSFQVVASGSEPLSYQWQRNGISIPDATQAILNLDALAPANNGDVYHVTISNPAGTINSQIATLTVSLSPAPVEILQQPINSSVLEGETATFSVIATGNTPLRYQWQRNGNDILGATQASLTLEAVSISESGDTLHVNISDANSTISSRSAVLTVSPLPIAPSITQQPSDISVALGSTATFQISMTGTPPLNIQWFRNDQAIAAATDSSFTFIPEDNTEAGDQFSVLISNQAGSITSQTAVLSILPNTANIRIDSTFIKIDNTQITIDET